MCFQFGANERSGNIVGVKCKRSEREGQNERNLNKISHVSVLSVSSEWRAKHKRTFSPNGSPIQVHIREAIKIERHGL